MSYFSNWLESGMRAVDPVYAQKISEAKESIAEAKIIAGSGIVAAVALAILGISGGVAVCTVVLFVATPLAYVSYNSFKVLENLDTFFDNPQKFRSGFLGTAGTINKAEFRKHILQGTFCFEFVIDFALDELSKPPHRIFV